MPITQRLSRYREGQKDFYLEQLYYQFGRYLLIASSRPGNLPANLQGIWHNNVDGPWRVDYPQQYQSTDELLARHVLLI